jgi:hypothetical protein
MSLQADPGIDYTVKGPNEELNKFLGKKVTVPTKYLPGTGAGSGQFEPPHMGILRYQPPIAPATVGRYMLDDNTGLADEIEKPAEAAKDIREVSGGRRRTRRSRRTRRKSRARKSRRSRK